MRAPLWAIYAAGALGLLFVGVYARGHNGIVVVASIAILCVVAMTSWMMTRS